MLKFNFQRFLKPRSIEKPFVYLTKHGFSRSFASRMLQGSQTSIRFRDLERLCVFFHSTPNDLMEWIPENENENLERHPLRTLRRQDYSHKVKNMLGVMTLEELEEVEKFLEEKRK